MADIFLDDVAEGNIPDADGVVTNPFARFLRTRYNYNTNAASIASGLECKDATRAQQQYKDECDINVIVERFGLTGELPQNVKMPFQAEFDEVIDYQTAVNRIMEADDAFMKFPAAVRERFQNDPQKLIEFATDPANLDEARKLGLALPARGEPEPMKVRIIPDTNPPAGGAAQ